MREIDPVNGGIGGAPKFPQVPGASTLLWRAGRAATKRSREAVLLTLEQSAQGGIYDHLGGGFARYSVDARWLVPHFEKMLYDNALLHRSADTASWQDDAESALRRARRRDIAGLVREMRLRRRRLRLEPRRRQRA